MVWAFGETVFWALSLHEVKKNFFLEIEFLLWGQL